MNRWLLIEPHDPVRTVGRHKFPGPADGLHHVALASLRPAQPLDWVWESLVTLDG